MKKTVAHELSPSELEIVCQIGSGSFGIVYLCKSTKTEQLYAMKVINKEKVIELSYFTFNIYILIKTYE